MNISAKIYKKKRKNDGGTVYVLTFGNKKITSKILSFGITNNKTTNPIKIPNIPDNLFNHFVRGFIDGDGSVGNNGIQIDFTEKSELCNQFIKKITMMGLPAPSIYFMPLGVKQKVQIIRIFWFKHDLRFKIREWLYKNASIYMQRKKDSAYKWRITPGMRYAKIGDKFGKLTIIGKTVGLEPRNKFICKCDCGGERKVLGKQLLSNSINHCGCSYKKMGRPKK